MVKRMCGRVIAETYLTQPLHVCLVGVAMVWWLRCWTQWIRPRGVGFKFPPWKKLICAEISTPPDMSQLSCVLLV